MSIKTDLEIAKIHLKTQLIWRADVVFNMLFTICKIIFAYLLWGAVFREKTEIAGFTFQSMLSYYIISSFLTQLEMSKGIGVEISDGIRNGVFSKYMILPLGIQRYFVAKEVGVISFYVIFDLLAAFLWVVLFQIQFTITTEPLIIVCAVAMIVLGLLFMVQLNYYLGILTMKYQDIGAFLMIKDNLMALITGSIIPLALFPQGLVHAMKLLPFYYVTYLPSMLVIGRCREEAVMGVMMITGWCIVLQGIIEVTWRSYRRKYDGVGI